MDSWQYDDVPISKFNVITEPNPIAGEIKQITDIAGKIQEDIIQTKSDQVRNALIDLGWTPPEGSGTVIPDSKLPTGFDREHWLIAAYECAFFGVRITEMPLHDLLACCAYMFSEYLEQR